MKKICFSILLALFISSCDQNLDIEPTGALTPETIFEDEVNLQSLLIGAYSFMRNELSGGSQTGTEGLANDGDLLSLGGLNPFDQKQLNPGDGNILFLWANLYRSINLANVILDNLELVEDPEQRLIFEGEAKFLRGLCYFELVRVFALPYEAGSSNTQPGIPIVLDGVVDASQITFPARNTVEEVYQRAITDLQEAYMALPGSNFEFADRYAAQAILARLYLQQENYVAARDAAHDVLENSGHFLAPDLDAAYNNEQDNIEDVFMWQITTQDGNNEFNEFWASTEFGGFLNTAVISVLPEFFEIFNGPDDRANFFYDGNGTILTSKWQNQFANVPFIRIAEMHLIRAEANFRLGSALGLAPENEINTIRARSNADPINGLSLQDILDERKRELAFEGHIFHDIKRLKLNVGDLPYNDNRLVMPIPQDEVDNNPNLEQNPGYFN